MVLIFVLIIFTTDGVSDTITTLGFDMPSLLIAFPRQFIAARIGLTDLEKIMKGRFSQPAQQQHQQKTDLDARFNILAHQHSHVHRNIRIPSLV